MARLDIQRCYEILELDSAATVEDAKKAHRDLVSIWHPDRVTSSNPRLKKKAEEKLKEINAAYQMLAVHLDSTLGKALQPDLGRSLFPEREAHPGNDTVAYAPDPPAAQSKTRFATLLPIFFLISIIVTVLVYSFWHNYTRIEYNRKVALEKLQLSEDHKRNLLEKLVKQRGPLNQAPSSHDSIHKDTQKKVAAGPPQVQITEKEDTPSRLSRPQPLDKKSLKQQEIGRIDTIIVEAGNFLDSKEYMASKNAYETALKIIHASQFKTDRLLLDRKRDIERVLFSQDLVYGSQGYVRYEDQWIAPDVYRKQSVKYKGQDTYYQELKNIIAQLTDFHIRKYLSSKYKEQLIHKKKIECYKIELVKNSPMSSHFKASYRWEIWTFKVIDEGQLCIDIAYQAETDQWEIGKIYDDKRLKFDGLNNDEG